MNRTNSNKRMELIVNGRKRDNKSITKKQKKRDLMLSPKSGINNNNKSALKRIKSSAALHQKIGTKISRPHNN